MFTHRRPAPITLTSSPILSYASSSSLSSDLDYECDTPRTAHSVMHTDGQRQRERHPTRNAHPHHHGRIHLVQTSRRQPKADLDARPALRTTHRPHIKLLEGDRWRKPRGPWLRGRSGRACSILHCAAWPFRNGASKGGVQASTTANGITDAGERLPSQACRSRGGRLRQQRCRRYHSPHSIYAHQLADPHAHSNAEDVKRRPACLSECAKRSNGGAERPRTWSASMSAEG